MISIRKKLDTSPKVEKNNEILSKDLLFFVLIAHHNPIEP
jgi:hypothetical protein